ncbi:hypothetical protein FH972_000837 [Carpinus fangiana]|uniref:Uncharacterized protein n=1 Tax=Carpinus fangiana TaxID=176857 RepID=A0A5N6QBR5_9ROSI|nr:hypothetical protein FH972_000837 [Carpinus fangiana]
MKRQRSYYLNLRHPHRMERKWIFPLAIGSIVLLSLIFLMTQTSPDDTMFLPFYFSFAASNFVFVKSKLDVIPTSTLPPPPQLGFLISGSTASHGRDPPWSLRPRGGSGQTYLGQGQKPTLVTANSPASSLSSPTSTFPTSFYHRWRQTILAAIA